MIPKRVQYASKLEGSLVAQCGLERTRPATRLPGFSDFPRDDACLPDFTDRSTNPKAAGWLSVATFETTTAVQRENYWKRALGSRQFGLNLDWLIT